MEAIFIGSAAPSLELFKTPKNVGFVKPDGGLWTSCEGPGGWIAWCRIEMPDWLSGTRKYRCVPRQDAVGVVINRLGDLINLMGRFGAVGSPSGETLNFEALAVEFDYIHLTREGQWATKFSRPGLYGWDCESTLWLRWTFEGVEDLGPTDNPG